MNENMIIEDKVRLKKKEKKINEKVYDMYFVSFSIKYTEILGKFEELYNVEILADKKIIIPKANLFKYSYYYRKRTGERIPQYSIVIPKDIGEELWGKGLKKLKIIVELPDSKEETLTPILLQE